jgi:hypothetical protein
MRAPSFVPRTRPRRARTARPFPIASALCIGVFGALVMGAEPARAQASTEDRVAAESLFSDARRLMQAGDYAHACPKLEASRRLEPGLGTTLNLGDCYEKLGRTASAWAEFKSAAAEAQKLGDALRKATALERAAALEPRLSRLQIDVADPSVSVYRNGEALSAAVLGSAIAVDPGSYELEARAPGKATWKQTVRVEGAAATVEVDVPALADEPGAAATSLPQPAPLPGAGPLASATPVPASPEPAPPAASSGGSERTLAWVLGGVGVAAVATGATFGLLASSSWSKAKDSCQDPPYECTPDAVSQAGDASSRATVATVAFLVGGAALGTSLVLFLTSSDEPASAELALSPSSVTLRGRF